MKKSFFSTALLAAGLALSTFVNAGEIADRVEQTKTLLVGTEGNLRTVYFPRQRWQVNRFRCGNYRKSGTKIRLES